MYALAPELTPLHHFDDAWNVPSPGKKMAALRQAAERCRAEFVEGSRVLAVATLPLAQLIYPTRFAFQGAASSPAPYVMMTHRALLVQFLQRGEVKHLLFNPTDVQRSRATPFFAALLRKIPPTVVELLSPKFPSLLDQLRALSVNPAAIDYVAFDHFHTQDLRGLLGEDSPFPKARLLAPRTEWEDWDALHPMQRAWFVAEGKQGVDVSRVVLTTGDLNVGDGVHLIRTPGHTRGNQTLFVNSEKGVWGCSENGTCVDAYSPLDSTIAGLSGFARQYDVDLILNSNTPESFVDQYGSMLIERTMVDRVPHANAFVQMFASSEITKSKLAPGLTPTLVHQQLTLGRFTS